ALARDERVQDGIRALGGHWSERRRSTEELRRVDERGERERGAREAAVHRGGGRPDPGRGRGGAVARCRESTRRRVRQGERQSEAPRLLSQPDREGEALSGIGSGIGSEPTRRVFRRRYGPFAHSDILAFTSASAARASLVSRASPPYEASNARMAAS